MSHNLTQSDAYIPPDLIGMMRSITPKEFERICRKYPDLRLELTSTGELIVMPPTGSETGLRNFNLIVQLGNWAKKDGIGVGFGSCAGFTLPNGAIRSPDASWIRRERCEHLTPRERKGFAPICPDFVVELRSETDRLSPLLSKMEEYIANGAAMGWLIDPLTRSVHIYRPGQEPFILENPEVVSGDPVLPGFRLEMGDLW
jgi:Uma2 family endonuclease